MQESECYPAIKALNINMESVTCIIVSYYLRHRRWTKVVFPPPSVCLSVCLSVCEQDISKGYRRIWTKLGGQVRCVTKMHRLDFGEDLNLDQDTTINK